jgi:flagellar motility protein MotE (MotC chaperone)
MTDALLLENRNNFMVKKLNKKVRFYRSRQEQEENQTKTPISNQLNPISEIIYKRGYRVLYGSCHKHVYPKGHQKLVEGMNCFMKTIEDCRDTFNGCETRHFQDIIKDYCEKKEREIKDAKALCAKLVKVKNCELDEKLKEVNSLSEEVEKLRKENEAIRKNMDNEIREKVREGVRQSLLSMPMLSSCLGIKTFNRAREHSESTDFTQNSDHGSFYHADPRENSEEEEEEGFLTETADDDSDMDCPATRITHNYNIFNNYMYSEAKVYQS